MRIYTSLRHSLLAVVVASIPIVGLADIQHSIAFSVDKLTVSQDTISDDVYCKVTYEGLFNTALPGYPSLPVKHLTFSVPYDAYNITVSAVGSEDEYITLPAMLIPEQAPQVSNSTSYTEFTPPADNAYSGDQYSPAEIAGIVEDGYLEGDNHLITIAISPLKYNPEKEKVVLYKQIDITISYRSGDGTTPLSIQPILRKTATGRDISVANVKSVVANPTQVDGFLAPLSMALMANNDTTSVYEYCIVTSRELAPAFNRLVALKRHKGYNAGIVCMEDIITNPLFAEGDDVSGIIDDAGKLRAYLRYSLSHGCKFVLLGGKQPHVPFRYANDGWTSGDENDPRIPTDMYFGELQSNWDSDQDGIYGEKNDNIEFFPDIYVGRLPCKNQEEAGNYIDKLIKYELNPGNGDYDYLSRSFCSYSTSMLKSGDKTKIEKNIGNIFPQYTSVSQNESYPCGSEVISLLNSEKPFYISLHGHGGPNGILLTDTKWSYPSGVYNNQYAYGINALDNETTYIKQEENNGLDCLNNKNYPGIMYSMSCTTMPYDIYTNADTTYNVTYNVGESYTLGKDYGGVAYLGNTRVGAMGTSTTIEHYFLEQLLSGETTISKAEAYSKINFSSFLGTVNRHLKLAHNLYGDPSIDVWTNVPSKFTDAEIGLSRNESSIDIYWSALKGSTVVAYDLDGTLVRKEATSNSCTIDGISSNSHIIIYRHDMIPFVAPIQIQKANVKKSQYFLASSANIGILADANRETGEVVFSQGADFTVEALEDVVLGSGVTIESGAKLTIKTSGKCHIYGVTVKSGGNLVIEASESNMNYAAVTAEKGATVIIKNNINLK